MPYIQKKDRIEGLDSLLKEVENKELIDVLSLRYGLSNR